ncbi:MAG: 16S rRNA (cytidine(1402)-2'-O)-methyltransferase [Bradymonadales bacterium]|nr:16S rRNA (cytidine(1402)-2'-O)-methyltransferase [Bradymonadales bacterium]
MPLYLVASPIGNLDDISHRAIETLRRCTLIAAEDTRRTGQLLRHLGIKGRLLSYYDAVEKQRIPGLLTHLLAGEEVALITDAGTPCLSDPGFPLVREAIKAGVTVIPIPGPSAMVTALAASGLPTDRFRFEGYLPRSPGKRLRALEALVGETATTIFFEVPTRLLETLQALADLVPNRQVVVACELTKLHERFVRGTAAEVVERFQAEDRLRGEFTLLVGGVEAPPQPERDEIRRYVAAMRRQGFTDRTIRTLVAELLGIPKKAVFESTE